MAPYELNPRSRRIVVAGYALAAGQWQSTLSRATNYAISQRYLAMIASGKRPVTKEVERTVVDALMREADALREKADRLDHMAGVILRSMDG